MQLLNDKVEMPEMHRQWDFHLNIKVEFIGHQEQGVGAQPYRASYAQQKQVAFMEEVNHSVLSDILMSHPIHR